MEAQDNEPSVHPISIEDDDGELLPEVGGRRRREARVPRRPWMPLAVSAMAVAALIGAVTFFGAVEFQDAPTTDPETFSLTTIVGDSAHPTEALPPTLAEMIPGITERLTLVTTDDGALWIYVWDPTFRVPNEFITMAQQDTEQLSASFDVGGRYVAVGGQESVTLPQTDVWVGLPTEIDPTPDVVGVRSYAWHSTEVSRLAYLKPEEGGYALETVTVDALSKTPSEADASLDFSELGSIVRWDNAGFIIQVAEETVAIDPTGTEIWRIDGWAHGASPNFLAQIRDTGTGQQWYLVDRDSAERVSFTEFGVDADTFVTQVVASPNSDIFAAVTARESGSTVKVVGPAQNTPRISRVGAGLYPYQFTSDSTFLVLRSFRSNDLTFVDWRTGATHVLEVPNGKKVLAINIG